MKSKDRRKWAVADRPEFLIADQHVPDAFVAIIRDILAGEDIGVTSVNLLRWHGTSNGVLQERAVNRGHRAIFTFDKAMADETEPRMPVLVLDAVELTRERTAAQVLGDVLNAHGFDEPDYYPVLMPWARPTYPLRVIAEGLYAQNKRDGFAGKGFLKAHWDTRPISVATPYEKRRLVSRRARFTYRREQGLPLDGTQERRH